MRTVTAIALHDLRGLLNDRAGLIWSFLMPAIFATFFGLVFRDNGGSPSDAKVHLSVLDQDGGPVAADLRSALEAAHLDLHHIDADTPAAQRVRTLNIPADFSTQVEAGTPVTLRLEKEPDTNVQAAFVAQGRILAAVADLLADLASADLASTETTSSPPSGPLVGLDTKYAGQIVTVPSGFSQSVPGNAVMFVLLIALTYGAASLTSERIAGTLRRLASAPVSRTEIVIGKVVGRLLVAVVQISVFVVAGAVARRVLGIDLGGDLRLLWLVLFVYALAVAPLGILFGALFREPDTAANVGTLATLGMAALGGCWWPLEVVPETMQRLALIFPTGWAMKALHQIVSFGHGVDSIVVPLAVLLAFGTAFTFGASRFLRWT